MKNILTAIVSITLISTSNAIELVNPSLNQTNNVSVLSFDVLDTNDQNTYTVQWSSDLLAWNYAGTFVGSSNAIPVSVSVTNQPAAFVRVLTSNPQ